MDGNNFFIGASLGVFIGSGSGLSGSQEPSESRNSPSRRSIGGGCPGSGYHWLPLLAPGVGRAKIDSQHSFISLPFS